jgi:hypothetical protein
MWRWSAAVPTNFCQSLTFYKSKKRRLADCKITEHALKHKNNLFSKISAAVDEPCHFDT